MSSADINFVPKYTGAPSLSSANDLETYQDNIVMNVGTSVEDVNKTGARYYLNLQNYFCRSSLFSRILSHQCIF